jgi:Tol biopolymer transport system component
MPLPAGQQLGSYEIVALLGRGGMGEVYRARDARLKRDVALKILPDEFSRDPERLSRFQREAEALATLNHPNIAGIYDLQQHDTTRFLVLELIEGETLADRLRHHGRLTLDEVRGVARQICEALEAAHEKGIVHRDLKPGNLKIRPDGQVKVLDFGLAKAIEQTPVDAALTNSPTLGVGATHAGIILGTAAYMSPEQAKGRIVDRRSDIFAFGCVLYEMLAGRPAFEGDDVTEILGRVVTAEPDWSRLPAGTPASIRRLLQRALRKNPRERLADIRDARMEIEEAATVADAPAAPEQRHGPGRIWLVSVVATLVLAAVLAVPAVRHLVEPPPVTPPEMRLEIATPATSEPLHFALSPDGRQIAFIASGDGPQRLWVRSLGRTDARALAGTEDATLPFWSPDGRSLGFFTSDKLYRIDAAGGAPQLLADVPVPRGASWSVDGAILYAATTTGPILRVPATGGKPTAVTTITPGQTGHRFPHVLPDTRRFLFYATGSPEAAGIYLGSLDGEPPTWLMAADSAGAYLNPGHVAFVRQGALVAQRLDLDKGELVGDPVTLAAPVGYEVVPAFAGFSVSRDGLVAYRAGTSENRELIWFDRGGRVLSAAAEDANDLSLIDLSPDGRRVLVARTLENNQDVWVMDLSRGGFSRVTHDPANEYAATWSPDGTRIVFSSNRTGRYNLYLKASGGTGDEALLLDTPFVKVPQDWSKDGRFLMYYVVRPETGRDLEVIEPGAGEPAPRVVANSPFDERYGRFSPDGRWVAYATNESGRFEVVIQPFPEAGRKWQVSTGGGSQPQWRADGRELYFLSLDGRLMSVPLTARTATPEVGQPVALFGARVPSGYVDVGAVGFAQYAVSRDGRFLVNRVTERSTTAPITLILHWNPERPE